MSNRQQGDANSETNGDGSDTADDSGGADLPAPRPDRTPEAVVRTVLSALASNDDPVEDAGIRTAFGLAAPEFRARAGGSLEAFAEHLTGPINRALVDHRESRRGRLRTDDGTATEKVVVVDADGDASTYEFAVERQTDGKYEGCWMVTGIDLVYVGVAPDHRHMPVVEFDGVEVKCQEGDVLRDVLLRASGVSPHNTAAQYANCNGKGLCGTCAVEIAEGEVTDRTAQEKRRLRLPPHNDKDDPSYRLACQTRVRSDLVVRKHEGFWGQHVEEYAAGTEEDPDADPIRVTDEEYRGETAGGGDDDDADRESGSGSDGDDEDLDLSDETRGLLEETRRMLDRDRSDDDGD